MATAPFGSASAANGVRGSSYPTPVGPAAVFAPSAVQPASLNAGAGWVQVLPSELSAGTNTFASAARIGRVPPT